MDLDLDERVLLRRSVLANAVYPLRLLGHGRADARLRAEAALERVGLGRLLHRPARQLSGGEQQKLALARAWALGPEVLFLDEPTAALDPAATRAVEAVVEAIAESGTKVVMTSHDLAQARRLAGEVLFLHHGRVLERTGAAEFFAGPRTEEHWDAYVSALECRLNAEDEAFVNRMVTSGHPSTPGYNDPSYPIEGRVPR